MNEIWRKLSHWRNWIITREDDNVLKKKKKIRKKIPVLNDNDKEIYSLTPDDDTNTFGFSLASMIACARYLPRQIK